MLMASFEMSTSSYLLDWHTAASLDHALRIHRVHLILRFRKQWELFEVPSPSNNEPMSANMEPTPLPSNQPYLYIATYVPVFTSG